MMWTIICMKAICHLGCDYLCIYTWVIFCWASLPFLTNSHVCKKMMKKADEVVASGHTKFLSFPYILRCPFTYIPVSYPIDRLQLLLRDPRVQNDRVLSLHIEAKREYFLRIAQQFQSHVDNARKQLPPGSIELRCAPPKSTSVHTTDIV